MSKTVLFLGLNLVNIISLKADGVQVFSGAANAGSAFSCITQTGPWELFNNVAGINQYLNGVHLLNGYSLLYNGIGISKMYSGITFPFKKAGIGLGFQKTGEKDFHETLAGLAIGNKIRNVSLGIKINYFQVSITESKTIRRVITQFGGIAEFSRHFLLGAQIYNLNQAAYHKESSIYLPVIMSAGITCKPLENIRLNLISEKENDLPTSLRMGIEYFIDGKLWLRTGLSTHPVSHFAGVGLENKKFVFDYSFRSHSNLGMSHHVSMCIVLKKKK
jgi:hypothetical protein